MYVQSAQQGYAGGRGRNIRAQRLKKGHSVSSSITLCLLLLMWHLMLNLSSYFGGIGWTAPHFNVLGCKSLSLYLESECVSLFRPLSIPLMML